MDEQTLRNLELFRASRAGAVEGSLLSIIDLTKTPMGGRLLKKWLGQPLLDIKQLERRQQAVTWFQSPQRAEVISLLSKLSDVERLINRVRAFIATPRELVLPMAWLCRPRPALRSICMASSRRAVGTWSTAPRCWRTRGDSGWGPGMR